ncbi:MAG: hypothetical protein HLX51_05865 [Micrococcaceae bacterium]|nr:hypothetical protein [Micrococcaceae bacterium]
MSVETLTIVISAAGLLITLGGGLFAGFAWMIGRMDDCFAEIRGEFRQDFRGMHEEFGSVREDIQQLRGEMNDIKISVARLEGPRQRLI